MHRIDTPTAQKDKFGAGKNGFTAGNPQTGTPATDLDNDYFDMLQEELAGVVEATGVDLDKSKHNQLLTALNALLLSRAHPFADIKADGAAAIAEALSNLGLTNGNGSVGRLIGCQIFHSSGTYVKNTGAKNAFVQVQGAGGGGDGTPATAENMAATGSGGGAGGYSCSFISLDGISTVPITIGVGGSGGNGTERPTTGGTTIFGTYITANGGGVGGNVGPAEVLSTVFGNIGGGGGGSSGGNIMNCLGGSGGTCLMLNGFYQSGSGGDSFFSGGGSPISTNISLDGYQGVLGSGGGGAYSIPSTTSAKKGGDGGNGVIIIWEYA